jgi:hypothetical protein
VVLGLLLVFAACGDDDGGEEEIEEGTPVDTNLGKEVSPPPTEEPDEETGLPVSFPQEFPIYAGAQIIRASDIDDRYVIEWETEDDIDDVSGFFNDQLDQDPWTVSGAEETDGVVLIDFSGELTDDYSGNIAIAPAGGDQVKIILNLSVDG